MLVEHGLKPFSSPGSGQAEPVISTTLQVSFENDPACSGKDI
jgi:hypothetical protein